mmetsp:Transcript_109281/g.233536  ORF Transcript_109281/g.233536 Transcript_109281/m.233536 type:complete len:209 (-) Transcript_109281:415-1041(-)
MAWACSREIVPPWTSPSSTSLPPSLPSKTSSASLWTVSAPRRPRITLSTTFASTAPSRNSSTGGSSTPPSPMALLSSATRFSEATSCKRKRSDSSATVPTSAFNCSPLHRLAFSTLSPTSLSCLSASVSSHCCWTAFERSNLSRCSEGEDLTTKRVVSRDSSQSRVLTCLLEKQRKGGTVRKCSWDMTTSSPPTATQLVNSSSACVSV